MNSKAHFETNDCEVKLNLEQFIHKELLRFAKSKVGLTKRNSIEFKNWSELADDGLFWDNDDFHSDYRTEHTF